MRNKTTRILVTVLGGWLGIHKFMDKQIGVGILYLLTGGLFGIGWIIDIIKACVSPRFEYNHSILLTPPSTPIGNGLYEAYIDVAGSSYYYDTIVRCLKKNPKYDLSDNDIINLGSDRIYEFFPFDSNAVLKPEPTNHHDANAVMVLVDSNLVGYVPSEYAPFIRNLIEHKSLSFSGVSILGGNVKYCSNNNVVICRGNFHVKLKFVYRS